MQKTPPRNPAPNGRRVAIRPLQVAEHARARAFLAGGMRDNPLHLRVFGANADHRQRRLSCFLGWMLGFIHGDGEVMAGLAGDEIVGLLGMMPPGHCHPPWPDRLGFARAMLRGASPAETLRILRWLHQWMRNDPCEPHWHIGPLVVAPGWRRQGIGRRLMRQCCDRMDRLSATAWLETDLAVNAAFYETLGFRVVRRQRVLGVPNWFMIRMPQGGQVPRPADPAP